MGKKCSTRTAARCPFGAIACCHNFRCRRCDISPLKLQHLLICEVSSPDSTNRILLTMLVLFRSRFVPICPIHCDRRAFDPVILSIICGSVILELDYTRVIPRYLGAGRLAAVEYISRSHWVISLTMVGGHEKTYP